MFASPAYAAAAGAGSSGGAAFLSLVFPFVLVGLIFYILVWGPQNRKMKQHRAKLEAVKKNDSVVTGGGLLGKVTRVEDDQVEIEIASNVRVKVLKTIERCAATHVDPTTGTFQSQTSLRAGVSLSPVVANSTLYVLDDSGRLHAFR